MINFNLQLFALVKDALGKEVILPVKKKTKTKKIPKVPVVKDEIKVSATSTTPETKVVGGKTVQRTPSGGWTVIGDAGPPADVRSNPNYVPAEDRVKPIPQDTQETDIPVEQGPTAEQLRRDLLRLEEQQKLEDVAREAEIATGAVRDREELIAPKIKGLKSTASVSTQLGQKRLKDIFAATGAAAGTGAAKQIAAEQGLQSQLGALDVQESQERAQIAKDISDIQSEKAFLERQIKAGTATAETQAKLESLQAEQEAAAREAEINSEREFQLFKQSLDQFNEIETINLKNSLDRDNKVLDAEIERLENIQLFEQDVQLKAQAAEDARRLQSMRNSNSVKLAEINNKADEEQIRLRGEQDRATAQFKEDIRGAEVADDFKPNVSTLNASLKNALGDTSFMDSEEVKINTMNWMIRNADLFDANSLMDMLTRNNISPQELEDYENRLEQAATTPPFQ